MTRALTFLAVGAFSLGGLHSVAADTLQVTVTTSQTATPQYAPKNVVAVWVEAPGGAFVKTIGRWAGQRKQYLLAWTTAAGGNDVDAVTGATRASHAPPLTITWDVLGKQSAPLADGTYTIRMESTDRNANAVAQNNEGTFTFVKGPSAQTQSNLSNGGFSNVSITYTPVAVPATCNNGAVDVGETCDPGVADSCPASCADSGDACAPNVLVGSAAACSAACVSQTVSACVDGDGCCAAGCTEQTDADCVAGAGGDPEITSGCATSSSAGLVFALGALAFIPRRRRA